MCTKNKGLNFFGQLLLLSATVVWGSSFIILKETIQTVPALYVIGLRFLVSALVLGLVFIKRIKVTDKQTFINGVILGTVLAGAYITQTLGLKYIGAGKNAFITSLYCVMCPFLMWTMFGVKPKSYNLVSAVLCVIGIGLVAISGSEKDDVNVFLGCALTFFCAIFFTFQIVLTGKFHERKNDAFQLLFVQLLTVGVIISLFSLAFELPFCGISAYVFNAEQARKIIYLTAVCTLYAQMAQIFGIKFTEPTQASIILTLEAVFGVVFAIILGNERITPVLWAGFTVIFCGTVISELKIDMLGRLKHKFRNLPQKKDENGKSY